MKNTVSDLTEYNCEPNLVSCDDGSILCVYRHGASHIDNTGRICARRSVDDGNTWGAEFVIADGDFDVRNPSVGNVDGRIVVFGRVYDAVNNVHLSTFCMWSDDHGATFGAPVDLPDVADLTPYGRPVHSTRGWLMGFYATDRMDTLRLVDGVWTDPQTIYNLTQTADFQEPVMVRVTDNDIAIVIRCGGLRNMFASYYTHDGGLTWKGTPAVAWTSTSILTPCPIWGEAVGDKVFVCWFARHSHNKLFATCVADQMFSEDPTLAWVFSTAFPSEPRMVLATARKRHTGYTTAEDRDFGYANPLALPSGEVLVAWYDSADGTCDNTAIYCTKVRP